ncbi:MAG: lipopolysaccharide kinase InaA family protein [Methylophilaceae bacterium]
MTSKQPSMLTRQVIFDGLSYFLRGNLRIKNGHLPQPGHAVTSDFFGICVASNVDSATDAFVISELKALGISNVRLDFSYDDLDGFNARFLQTLIHEKFDITLHLLPPFAAAKNMTDAAEQAVWKAFLQTVLDRYGAQLQQVEIGNTINRKRWSGFNFDGFLVTWQIAHTEVKARGIKLLGPNVQDFEPFYNISLLKTMQANHQLPDIHTNNLFVERVSEPERFDHRIFKYRWATIFRYNLIKKARILQNIGHHFGVIHTTSSAAFWAIYRIERLLKHGKQKQADYLTRYFTLLATSGALQQANWGALICHREGLINDGLLDAEYPPLERITHYKRADGELKNYARYPSFYAMQMLAKLLIDTHYEKAIATANGLEIHHFNNRFQHIHVAWTMNGKLALLKHIYAETTLNAAKILHRDGEPLNDNTEFITETPIYLIWDIGTTIITKPQAELAKTLTIHKHVENLQYFHFDNDGWQGLVLAKNADEATLLMHALHPNQLQSPQKKDALRHARNAIWAIEDPRDGLHELTIKQPITMYPHKTIVDRFRPSKAKRSWNGAMELLRRDIATAQPVAYFEKVHDPSLKQNFYICEFVKADCTLGQIFAAFAQDKPAYLNLNPENVYKQFAQFCHKMHSRGIYFRDFSGGNILVNISANDECCFSLIDTARIHAFNHSLAFNLRIADLTRACHKLDWVGRKRFMQLYLGLTGRQFRWQYKLPFYLYDIKVALKHTVGRKGLKRLIKRLKGDS